MIFLNSEFDWKLMSFEGKELYHLQALRHGGIKLTVHILLLSEIKGFQTKIGM
jgi:hypothetical protein